MSSLDLTTITFDHFLYSKHIGRQHRQLQGNLTCIQRNTVKPVYRGHSREPENVNFISSCPLYIGYNYMQYSLIASGIYCYKLNVILFYFVFFKYFLSMNQ
jgi:hypothetical protein